MRTMQITTAEQLDEAFAIRMKVFVEEQGVPAEEELDEADKTAQHVLTFDELGQPVGTGRLLRYDDETAKLGRIAVHATGRGKGYGRAIIQKLEEIGIRLGYRRFILDAQVQAEPFYQKLGYQTLSPETFLDGGIPHVRMEKRV